MAQANKGVSGLINRFFGFNIGNDETKAVEKETLQEIVPQEQYDGAASLTGGGMFGTYLDLEGTARTESALILRYRQMSLNPECEKAIDQILHEVILDTNRQDDIVDIAFNDVFQDPEGGHLSKIPVKVKNSIRVEFNYLMRLLDFKFSAYEIFRRWYVDGRLYYHVLIDTAAPEEGIKEVRFVDPLKMKKVREINHTRTPEDAQKDLANGKLPQPNVTEYFVYSPSGFINKQGVNPYQKSHQGNSNQYIKISPDSIVYVPSGLMDESRTQVLGYMHKAIRPLNLLRLMEDAMIIYRISRAPERRVFYVDVGSMPRQRGQQYMNQLINQYRNKLVYDASTGEIKDDRRYQTMLEDYWLPRQEGSKGTEVTTLPGGQNLGQIEDIEFLQTKLYESLNVPLSRLQPEQSTFSFGRPSEITRDEVMFKKFIDRLRLKFSKLFYELLKRQLILKNIIAESEWDRIREEIFFEFKSDVHYEELKEAELIQSRFQNLQVVEPYIGKYISHDYVRKVILRQTDQQISDLNNEIEIENKEKQYEGDTPDAGGGGGFGGF